MTNEERIEKIDEAMCKLSEITEYLYKPFDDGDAGIEHIDFGLNFIEETLLYYKDELLGNV